MPNNFLYNSSNMVVTNLNATGQTLLKDTKISSNLNVSGSIFGTEFEKKFPRRQRSTFDIRRPQPYFSIYSRSIYQEHRTASHRFYIRFQQISGVLFQLHATFI